MPVLDTPITTDDRGLKKVLGQKQPAVLVLLDAQRDKPLEDAMQREAKKRAGELLVVKVDASANPETYAKYDQPTLPALVTMTPAFFGRSVKSTAEGVRPADLRAHIAHLLDDAPLLEDKPKSAAPTGKRGKPVKVTDSTFRKVVLKSKVPVLVDFWAAWCGPCMSIAPYLEKVAEKYEGKVVIAKLNVDENRRTQAEFGIQSIPTFIVFQDGQPVQRSSGASPRSIDQLIQSVL